VTQTHEPSKPSTDSVVSSKRSSRLSTLTAVLCTSGGVTKRLTQSGVKRLLTSATRSRKKSKLSGKPKRTRSTPELLLERALRDAGINDWVAEHKFHDTRKWRFDFAWPPKRVAVEVEGGVFSHGRHNRPAGFIADAEKYNAASLAGWLVLRVVPQKGWIENTLLLIRGALMVRASS
jgi:very-short-patch-repair endonuclease